MVTRLESTTLFRRGGVEPELCMAAGLSPLNTWTITDADSGDKRLCYGCWRSDYIQRKKKASLFRTTRVTRTRGVFAPSVPRSQINVTFRSLFESFWKNEFLSSKGEQHIRRCCLKFVFEALDRLIWPIFRKYLIKTISNIFFRQSRSDIFKNETPGIVRVINNVCNR